MAKKRNNVKETELITENLIEDTQHSRLDYLLYAIDCSQMDENLIEECKNKESLSDLFWGELSVYGNLSEELIEKYKDKLNLGFIFLSKNLSRDFYSNIKNR